MFKNKILKANKGIMISDALIAMLIILLFSGIVIALITNITVEKTKISQNSMIIDFATKMLEYVEKLPYADVTEENLINYVNSKNLEHISAGRTTDNLTTEYRVIVNVENYNQTEGNTDKYDFIKIVTITIESSLEGKANSIQFSKIKKANMKEVETILNNLRTE